GGGRRGRHGIHLEPRLAGREMRLAYRGLDDEERWTTLEWSDAPTAMAPRAARFEYELTPHKGALLTIAIRCERDGRRAPRATFEQADDAFAGRLEQARAGYAVVETSSEQFNRWVHRSAADLRMLVSQTPHGAYPYAGVPWFSTPFGRDGIITALQMLWINPGIARGVLEYLADTQADGFDE